MCVAISAIDSAQLPMEFALVGVLKKAVKIRFKLLTSGIKLATQTWTLPLLKTKLREWKIDNEIISQQSFPEKAHFTPAGRGRAPNSFKNRNQPREPRKEFGGAKPTHPDTVCFNCNKKGHKAWECRSPKREDNDRGGEKRNQTSSAYSGDYETGGDNRRARRDDDGGGENSSSGANYQKKKFPLKSKFKFKGKPGQPSGKYGGAKFGGSRENFMDADGDFISRPRSHFNTEKVSKRVERALTTITPQPNMYCVDSGSNTMIVNHLIPRFRNLRNLRDSITVETASAAGNLTIDQIFDVGEITAVRYCPEASASLVPPDILNDCGVALNLFKIRAGPRGR
jgi:hypothetical protein